MPASEAPGWLLGGRYRVLDRIGAGGMADVLRAHDELLSRDVAVKVFRTMSTSLDSAARQRVELEALAQLNHPNLITLFDGSIGGDGPSYLVMELVDGPSLAARIHEGPVPDEFVRLLGAQIADALAYVHAAEMVHRDVKPENILLGTDTGAEVTSRARLSDFGIVRLLDAEPLTRADMTVGTASYIAPEQARGSDVGPPADVYSLGLVLLETLTGRRPFDGSVLETLTARVTTRPAIPAGLPGPWPALLTAMTEIDPSARPTAVEIAHTLSATVTTPGLPVVDAVPMTQVAAVPQPEVAALAHTPLADLAAEPTTRHRGVWIAAAAAAVAIVTGIVLAIAGPSVTGGTGDPAPAAPPAAVGSSQHSKHSTAAPTTRHAPSTSSSAASSSASSSASTSPSAPSTSAASSSSSSSAPPTTSSPPSSSTSPSPSPSISSPSGIPTDPVATDPPSLPAASGST